jgi:hypothetical protein
MFTEVRSELVEIEEVDRRVVDEPDQCEVDESS